METVNIASSPSRTPPGSPPRPRPRSTFLDGFSPDTVADLTRSPDYVEVYDSDGDITRVRADDRALHALAAAKAAAAAQDTSDSSGGSTTGLWDEDSQDRDIFSSPIIADAIQGLQLSLNDPPSHTRIDREARTNRVAHRITLKARIRNSRQSPTGSPSRRTSASRDHLRRIAEARRPLKQLADEEEARTRPARMQRLANETARKRLAAQATWLHPPDQAAAAALLRSLELPTIAEDDEMSDSEPAGPTRSASTPPDRPLDGPSRAPAPIGPGRRAKYVHQIISFGHMLTPSRRPSRVEKDISHRKPQVRGKVPRKML